LFFAIFLASNIYDILRTSILFTTLKNSRLQLVCVQVQNKINFLRAGFYPANQSDLKALIGWKKATVGLVM